MNKKFPLEAQQIMNDRFHKDSLIAVATMDGSTPCVRAVNSFYEDGCFYTVTYALSGKMKQIGENPIVAVSGEWFSAQGRGINLGWFGKVENAPIADKMRRVFSAWIDNGHNNFEDENTCILCIRLSTGVLFANGIRYETDFR